MKAAGLRVPALGLLAGLGAWAQAPVLQDGATALREAQRTWAAGEEPLPPLAIPSLEVGLGGAGSDGRYTPLVAGEGLGHGTQGWGLGLQGRYVLGGWSFSATFLGLRGQGRTSGILQRAALAHQWESGWRLALEQGPFAWGSGLNGGDLLGDASRPFPRLSLTTPEVPLPLGRWRLEAFAGRLERDRPIPEWVSGREARIAAQSAGLDLQRPLLRGALVRASFGSLAETAVGAVTLAGGQDAQGHGAPSAAERTSTLAEVKVRVPALARLLQARGAALHLGRSAAPEDRSVAWTPARTLGGLRVVWEAWDLGLEYAGAADRPTPAPFTQPTYLADFSTHGDPLGPAFGRHAITRTVELGLPLFLEGQGRFRVVRETATFDHPAGTGSWFLQAEALWRTPTGRVGASLASRRNEPPGSPARWGWAFAVLQGFRVF